MTAPAYVNKGATGSTNLNTSVTPTLPASRVNGNLLLAWVVAVDTSTAHTFAFPGDWTVIGTPISTTNGNSAVAWRLVDGTEADPTISWSGSDAANSIIFQYSGVDAANPIGVVHNTAPVSPASATVPEAGITLGRDASLTTAFVVGDDGPDTVSTPPSGWTSDDINTTGNGTFAAFSSTSANTAGSGSPSFSAVMSQSRHWMAWTIELASEAMVTDLDITAAMGLGVGQTDVLNVDRFLTATAALGIAEVASASPESDIHASMGLGVMGAAKFGRSGAGAQPAIIITT